MKLSLFNTLTRKREVFTPLDMNLVKMYVCGPTVYDFPHIGNARSVVVYDILYRILIYLFGTENILYIRNITDVDDKIMDRASELSIPISELTRTTIIDFNNDMEYLGCLKPNKEPRATEHIDDMINIIKKLIDMQIAYEIKGHVYFDISKATNYTELSGRSINELYEAVRIDNDENKKNAGDFVLWKPASKDDDESAKFTSPFGIGRPGWHIECSAMSHKFLGETFDIHGGGIDLIFPHHTNEIAQSCSAFPGSKHAKYWVHNGFLTVNNEKMSKSLGNFITVRDFINRDIHGETARLFMLSAHYRKPLDYNEKAIIDAEKMLNYWYRALENLEIENQTDNKVPEEFLETLFEDLNTHMAIKLINDLAKTVHTSSDLKIKQEAARKMINSARFIGLMNCNRSEWFQGKTDSHHINALIEERKKAKIEKNWKIADEIRSQLGKMNITIEDKADGTTIWKKT